MTTKTIFDLMMPDFAQMKADLQSLIAQHSNPKFAADVCGELSPMFLFITQKSWQMLENQEMIKEVEDICLAANKLSPDLVKMLSWLMLLLQYRREDDMYKEVHRLTARHMIITDRKKRKLRERLLQLIDNPDIKISALALVKKKVAAQPMEPEANHRDDLMVNEYGETMDVDYKDKVESSQIEDTENEIGIPRLEWLCKSGKPDWVQLKHYKQRIDELQKKRKQGNFSEEDRKEYNKLVRYAYNGRIRYDYPQTDKAGANLRSQRMNFCKGLIKKIGNPKFGSDIIREGFISTGRKNCAWVVKGIANEWLGIGKDGKEKADNRVMNVDDLDSALGALLSGERWTWLEVAHLKELNPVELTLLRSLYETGRQSRMQNGFLPLNESYQKHADACNCDWQAKDLGEKANLLPMLEIGLRHFGIIE